MKKSALSRLLSLVLVLSLVCGLAVPAMAAPGETEVVPTTESLNFEKVDTSVSVKADHSASEAALEMEYLPTDVVRVSIVVDKPATLTAGFSSENVAQNVAAVSYRDSLKANQAEVAARIEKVTGEPLDVVWNLTLAANLISANVKFAQIAEIEKVAGVKEVAIENRYEPQTADESADEPNMGTSTFMIGSNVAWAVGYYGAGSKVAVIDTGIDDDHQSFAASGYNYAMGLNAEEAGMTLDEYKASVGVLTAADVAAVADQLNVTIDASKTYLSDKVPYAYNYVDKNYTINHDSDSQGEHGSHVEGIAASNRFIPQADGSFKPALETVMSQGVAPDAQIVTMKVFGEGGGAYDSDYMAAIEDAIVLGCDSANLSLGSGNPGFAHSGTYQNVMDSLTECSTVVAMSAGNSGGWYDNPQAGGVPYLYQEDISMATNGSPGSFTNSLGVASVDNSGNSGMPLMFGDIVAFYTETSGYTNPPIAATIPGENNFIFFDNTAVDGSGTDLLAPYADDIGGKVVLVYRGSSSFYQKMDAAAAHGAIACIIVNNQDGTINMDLSSATSEIPCVSITQADGAKIKEAYETTTLSDGTVVWTGTFNVTNTVQIVPGDSEYYTISSFSSWGVPGALTLKPEIAAPGGNIYAVNGAEAGGKGYELMSGTSMASPQVAGMAALVGQYVRENGLVEKTGLTARQLANSLLMSTAVPMWEDYGDYGDGYYPVLRQGAGLANVGAAVSAKSYILMGEDSTASAADGKVKAELGDDPARTGEYTWSFTVNNFSEDDVNYNISSTLFTQDVTSDGKMLYMDTWTAVLPFTETITVDGEVFEQVYGVDADVNMDGVTNADDAQAILNYVVGLVTDEDIDAAIADMDADGKVTTYDAYVLLSTCENTFVTVPAGKSVEVTVAAALSEDAKEFLDTYYVGGAYIEGYTFVSPDTSAEGAVSDVTYSVPVLGFYGSWTDASMFDNTSVIDVAYGTDVKVPYTGNKITNGMYVRYGADNTNNWFLGNPYVEEDSFPADRLAANNDVNFYQFRYNLIRNAAGIAAAITDENGKVLWNSTPSGNVAGAYYYTNGSAWRNTATSSLTVNKTVGSLGVTEGSKITVGAYAIPEYYANPANGKLTSDEFKAVLESGVLGDGASISYTVTVDNTAPVVTAVTKDLLTGDITITAQDDNYIAAVMMATTSGKLLGATLPEQDAPNQVCTAEVDLKGANPGAKALVVVGDYAGNEAVYEIEYSSEPVTYDGNMYGFTSSAVRGSGNRWVEITPDTLWYNTSTANGEGMDVVSNSPITVTAADYVNGYVFMAAANGIYVAPQGEWDAVQKVGKSTKTFIDMAYNTVDGVLYALDDANTVWSIDTTTGAQTKVATVKGATSGVLTLAIDDNGTFYAISKGGTSTATLYSFTLEDVVDGEVTATAANGKVGGWVSDAAATTAWDHDADVLYLAAAYSANDYDNKLWVVDTTTGVGTLANTDYAPEDGTSCRPSCLQAAVTGLYIVPSKSGVPAVTAPTSIEVTPEAVELMVGTTENAIADVYPWNLADKSVTWTTSDETVAAVSEDGVITAVAPGTATITVTTVATPALTAEVAVTVVPVPVANLKGLIYAVDGTPNWSEFSTDAPENATVLAQGSAYYGGVLVDDTLYMIGDEELYAVDADSFATEDLGVISTDWMFADGAAVPEEMIEAFSGSIVAPCMGGTYLEVLNPSEGKLTYWSGIASIYAEDPMAAIALVGTLHEFTDSYGDSYVDDAVEYAVITENGELWAFVIYDGGKYLYREDLGSTGLTLGNVSAVTAGVYASMIYDQASGCLFLASYSEGETAQMYAINPETLKVALTGEFGDGVWPAVSLYQYTQVTELTLKVDVAELNLYAGNTATINAIVKPAAYTGGVTFTSADETVATVTEDGTVTAVAEGTTTITVETVDADANGKRSVVIPVNVSGTISVDAYIYGQVSTDSNIFAIIDLNDSSLTPVEEAPAAFTAGGMGSAVVYGVDGDGKMYEIESENFTVSKSFNFNTSYLPIDMANYPAITVTVEGTDYQTAPGTTFFTASQYLMSMDPVSGKLSGFNLSSWNLGFAAIAFAGYMNDADGTNLIYYAVTQSGDVYNLVMYGSGKLNASGAPSMTVSRSDVLCNLGMSFEDISAVSLAYYKDRDGVEGLIIADNTNQMLFWANIANNAISTAAPLTCIQGVTNVAGLFFDWDLIDDLTASDNVAAMAASAMLKDHAVMGTSASAQEPAYFTVGETANAVVGDTNAANVSKAQVRSAVGGTLEDNVVVTITEDVDVTNAKYVVTYDPAVLSLVSHQEPTAYVASDVDMESGVLTIALAADTAIAAGDEVAKIVFTRIANDATEVTVATTELNEDVACENTDTVAFEAAVHVCPVDFTDVSENAWYHEAVDYVVANGIMKGTSETTFAPNEPMTRAQLAQVFYNMAGQPDVSDLDNPFTDVKEKNWFYAPVVWAYSEGIVRGTSATTFGPGSNISRQDMVVMLYRTYGDGAVVETDHLAEFTDGAKVASYAKDAMNWAIENELIAGSKGALAPKDNMTRAQVATVFMRVLESGLA